MEAVQSNDEKAGRSCPAPNKRPVDLPTTLDGGYGWVVVLASFVVNFLVDGVCFSFGIFFLEFVDYYGESRAKTSWVGSVLNGMYLSVGPIVSALANRFGCRKVSIAGSVLATVAFSLSIFSPNIDVLILLYGGLGGLGFGLMYLPAIVMVGFYFEQKRALATGMAVCGSGIGGFVFAPLSKLLVNNYSWRGATLIIGAIVFNGVAMGCLFRPISTKTISRKSDESSPLDADACDPIENCDVPWIQDEYKRSNGNGILKTCSKSLENLAPQTGINKCPKDIHFIKSMDHIWMKRKLPEIESGAMDHLDVSRPMYRKDVFYSGSILHLPDHDYTVDHKVRPISTSSESVSTEDNNCSGIRNTFTSMLDLSLLTNVVFLLYALSSFICMTGFFVPFIYLPDYAIQLDISSDKAAFLLSILGITNSFGRILWGWVSDQTWADCLLINNCALVVGGAATMCVPFCTSYTLLATYSTIFGMCIAAYVSLRSIIIVELVGIECLTSAFGLVTLCQGMSSFFGAPIAGAMFDMTETYDASFYFAGATVASAGLMCFPLRCLVKRQNRLKKERTDESFL